MTLVRAPAKKRSRAQSSFLRLLEHRFFIEQFGKLVGQVKTAVAA
jgi:hypothetical protein